MRTALIRQDGSRLVIEPSPVFRNVRVWIPGDTTGIITIPLEQAKAFCQAVEGAALALHQADALNSAEG